MKLLADVIYADDTQLHIALPEGCRNLNLYLEAILVCMWA